MATSTIKDIPTAGDEFLSDLQAFLREEDAERFVLQFNEFVQTGGLHGTVAGLTGDPGTTVAFPGGFYVTETGTITYPDSTANNWVFMTADPDAPVTGDFSRVSGTHYIVDSISASQPSTPDDSIPLMNVTTAGGAITNVVDLRNTSPTTQATKTVNVSSDDTTPGFLEAKIVGTGATTVSVINAGGDEDVQISSTDEKIKVTSADTTASELNPSLLVTAPVNKTVNNPGGNETLTIGLDALTASDIADDTLTVTQIADQADGSLITWSTAGEAILLAPGMTSGYPLVTKGIGAELAYEQLATVGIADDAVTDAKLSSSTAHFVRKYDGSGNPTSALITSDNFTAGSVDNAAVGTDAIGQTEIANGSAGRGELKTSTESLSGSIPASGSVDITMNAYGFFPMIHNTQFAANTTHITGVVGDAASADSPRFKLEESSGNAQTYDVDYRYVTT